MKKTKLFVLSAIALIVSASSAWAQLNIDPETKKVQYQETVTLDSLGKEDIYERAKEWMTNNFKTNKFDVNDKATFKLGHEGNFPLSYTYDFKYRSDNTVLYTLTINIKEGKYRYTITDFKVYDNKLGPKSAQPLEASYAKMKAETKKTFSALFSDEVNRIIADMKLKIAANNVEEKEDW